MVMLPAKELAAMRQTAGLMLPDLCTRQVLTTAADGQGGVTETWADTTNIPCKLSPLPISARIDTNGQQTRVHSGWSLTIWHDQAMVAGDRVVIGGDTYEVLSVDDDHSRRTLRRAYMRRVE